MTLEQFRLLRPGACQVYEMKEAGKTWEEVCKRLGIKDITAQRMYHEVGRALRAEPTDGSFHQMYPDYNAPRTRCRCGLTLPCHDCVKPAWALAGSRPGAED